MKVKQFQTMIWLLGVTAGFLMANVLTSQIAQAYTYEATPNSTLSSLFLPIVGNTPFHPEPDPPPGTWYKYRVTYSVSLTKYEGFTKVWMPVPSHWSTQKDNLVISFTPVPSDDFIESHGNRIVYWEKTLTKGNLSVFSEHFEFSSLQTKWKIDEDSVGSYLPYDPAVMNFLGSSEFIQTDNLEIRNAAFGVVGNEKNPYIKAKLLFDFVVSYMNGYKAGINDALGAYKAKQGECGGYSHLFIALCRAVGVPARPITGIADLRQGDHYWSDGSVHTHLWAEYYLPNYGWVPADPIHTDMSGQDSFGISFGDRLILSKGSDIDLSHGMWWKIPWFHMPYVNGQQEEGEDLVLNVEIITNP